LALKGAHQRINAAVALQTLEVAGLRFTPEHLAEGLRSVHWPGRFQDTQRGFIQRIPVILGVLQDKDARGICAELAQIAEEFLIVPVRSPRAWPLEELQQIAAEWRPSRAVVSLKDAIEIARLPGDTPALITGSLFLIGETLVLLGLAEGGQEISAQ
jgi:dihydrofolate synthase/folylpolyglutamate synthase